MIHAVRSAFAIPWQKPGDNVIACFPNILKTFDFSVVSNTFHACIIQTHPNGT